MAGIIMGEGSTVAQIGTLSLLFEFFRVLCVRFISTLLTQRLT